MRSALSAVILILVLTLPAPASSPSLYVGQEARDIKTLSENEIADYLAGHGTGLAKAAELNHYPGPKHVLDLAKELGLTDGQQHQSEATFSRMQTRAMQLGLQIVAKERDLDQLFASGRVTDERLQQLLNEIAVLQGALRHVHLRAHLEQRSILTPPQLARYDALRGYQTYTPRHHAP